MKEKQTAGRRQLEEFAPEFARYPDIMMIFYLVRFGQKRII